MWPVIHDFDFFGLLSEPWSLHTYGVLIATGFVVALKLAQRQARRENEDVERVTDVGFYALLMGLIGARVVYIFTMLPSYLRDPIQILTFWQGGLVWYGGFLAAAGFVAWYCRRHRLDFFKLADMLIPFVALAHAFGRLGCLCAGCCYGKPTDLPWGVVFPNGSLVHAAHQRADLVAFGEPALPVHPTQLYEAGFELGMFWLLMILRPRKRFHGQLFLVWLATYPVARALIELARGDEERGVWLGLSTSQYFSVAVAILAVGLYWHLRARRAAPPAAA